MDTNILWIIVYIFFLVTYTLRFRKTDMSLYRNNFIAFLVLSIGFFVLISLGRFGVIKGNSIWFYMILIPLGVAIVFVSRPMWRDWRKMKNEAAAKSLEETREKRGQTRV